MKPTRLALAFAIASAGCVSVDTDTNEGAPGPTVEFDPAASIVPFPNNLVMDRATGKVALPEQCMESPATKQVREQVLNTLDGFGTYETALQFTLTEPVDEATLADHLIMYRRSTGVMPADPASATAVPIVILPAGKTTRFSTDCATNAQVDTVTIVPGVPLAQNSTYVVAVTAGLKTAAGADYLPSFTWGLVRQAADPVTIDDAGNITADRTPLDPTVAADAAQLHGVDLLWKAHAQGLGFLDGTGDITSRADVLLAWEFTTQTTTSPLDPTVTGSVAAMTDTTTPLLGLNRIDGGDPEAFLETHLGVDTATCHQLGCQNVGAIYAGGLSSANYQIDTPNPMTGGAVIPGPWNDPIHPTRNGDAQILQTFVIVPSGTPPVTGWPTIVFGHGLTRSKGDMFAIAPQLATAHAGVKFATVAIDFVAHGTRAVQTSNVAAIGCGGTPPLDPTALPQCFAPILGANLAATRDNVRQTVLDLQRLVAAIKLCTGTACAGGGVVVDAAKIGYVGQSLGGIIGSMVIAETDGIKAGVTNVAANGWLDIVENTASVGIRCSLVDNLIDAGVVVGDKWNLGMNTTTAICITGGWKEQESYRKFSGIARWILDPGDGANFASKLATRSSMLQEVGDDQVVPNYATDHMGALLGRTPANADPAAPPTIDPSAAVLAGTTPWVRYPKLDPDIATGFPGNTFSHGCLLAPANGNPDGLLGLARMQTDAGAYLIFNVGL